MSIYALKCFINKENLQGNKMYSNVLHICNLKATVAVRSDTVNVPVQSQSLTIKCIQEDSGIFLLILKMSHLAYMI